MSGSDREAIQQRTHELNDVTRHLAGLMMNYSVRQALAGKHVNDVGSGAPEESEPTGAARGRR
jgi:hypothetical protein